MLNRGQIARWQLKVVGLADPGSLRRVFMLSSSEAFSTCPRGRGGRSRQGLLALKRGLCDRQVISARRVDKTSGLGPSLSI